jgi:predicted dinucleotide-binding enzyme
MVNPEMKDGQPTMFICGNNSDAKKKVGEVLTQFGWDHEDMGMVESARAIEPLCILWCLSGLRNNDWYHAYRLLRK